jgi:hypothetical protein
LQHGIATIVPGCHRGCGLSARRSREITQRQQTPAWSQFRAGGCRPRCPVHPNPIIMPCSTGMMKCKGGVTGQSLGGGATCVRRHSIRPLGTIPSFAKGDTFFGRGAMLAGTSAMAQENRIRGMSWMPTPALPTSQALSDRCPGRPCPVPRPASTVGRFAGYSRTDRK